MHDNGHMFGLSQYLKKKLNNSIYIVINDNKLKATDRKQNV